jgi:hypothetical protein
MKFKIEKNNNFKNFKVKPLVFAIIMAGGMMAGTLTGCSSNGSDKLPTKNSNVAVTSVNSYKLNLNDFDKIVTPSFSQNINEVTHEIKECTVEENNYNAKALDGDNIISSFDNALLIDTEFERRQVGDLDNGLGAFDGAIINYYNEIKDVKINSISLEKIEDEYLFLFDTSSVSNIGDKVITEDEVKITEGVRVLQTIDNAVPYRILDLDTVISKYSNPTQIIDAFIEIGGQLIRCEEYMGSIDVKIKDNDFKLVCFKGYDDGLYREYLTTSDHVMIMRDVIKEEQPIKGCRLEYEKAIGNMNMGYRDNMDFYRTVNSLVLENDGLFYLSTQKRRSSGQTLMTIPAEYYSFEFKDSRNLYPNDAETLDISSYTTLFYDQNSFSMPIVGKSNTLAKINNNYFYIVNEPLSSNEKMVNNGKTAFPKPISGVYEVHSMALGKHITVDELNNNYVKSSEAIDFSFYLGVNTLSVDSGLNDNKYVAFKEINLLGLDYYSIVYQYVDANDNKTKYLEMLVPKTCTLIKGEQQDINRQKVYK